MEIYLVGGAVRDRLLGLPVSERDWVVVGSSESELRGLGYRSVGRDFPVFLHPDSNEEYALARTERKTASGHTGFECETDAVTLEEDLRRRDLTINAIAADNEGNLIDPWGGAHDIAHRTLRHVSPAFEEDPLRVLRAARFAARFHGLGFTLHPSTESLMRRMVERGDLSELAPERVWLEVDKALATESPDTFFRLLDQVGATAVLWPEISRVAMTRLQRMARRTADRRFRCAALLVDLQPRRVAELCERLRIPNRVADMARLAAIYYTRWREGAGLGPDGVIELLHAMDAFRQPERFVDLNQFFRLVTDAPDAALTADYWLNCHDIASSVTAADVDPALKGSDIGEAIRREQARRIGLDS